MDIEGDQTLGNAELQIFTESNYVSFCTVRTHIK